MTHRLENRLRRGIRCGVMLLSGLALLGCNVTADEKPMMPHEQPDYLALLEWVKTADPARDARLALARNDYRLLVSAGRGTAMPGIVADEQVVLTQRCGVQYLPGSTDVVRDGQHLERLKQAREYAVAYNQIMAPACVER